MSLPDDVCRCRDDSCPERFGCARWVERDSGEDNANTLRYRVAGTCTNRVECSAAQEPPAE